VGHTKRPGEHTQRKHVEQVGHAKRSGEHTQRKHVEQVRHTTKARCTHTKKTCRTSGAYNKGQVYKENM